MRKPVWQLTHVLVKLPTHDNDLIAYLIVHFYIIQVLFRHLFQSVFWPGLWKFLGYLEKVI